MARKLNDEGSRAEQAVLEARKKFPGFEKLEPTMCRILKKMPEGLAQLLPPADILSILYGRALQRKGGKVYGA
jgi:hypothetical protein